MTDFYEPPSDFLKAVAADEVPLSGSMFADANLARLRVMTRDTDRANRDWAVMLLCQQDLETPEIGTALREAADDDDIYVRSEAIYGLACRDTNIALPLALREFEAGYATLQILEAATELSHPSLLPVLRSYAAPSDDARLDALVHEAIAACSTAPQR